MNKPLYLFVGKSSSGKTTVSEILEGTYGYNTLQSYTTRHPRHENESGHIFLTDEEFNRLENIIAYTEYNNNRYCATKKQLDEASIYVVDVPGVETLLEKYDNDRPIVVVYFNTGVRTRIDRMIERGDSDTAIISRIYNDEEFDWENALSKLVWNYKHNNGKNVTMYTVDANQELQRVLTQVGNYMRDLEMK